MHAIWIFGYGSLVWRPAFEHAESRPATLRGWQRRFWQGSTDHRGIPGAPGRVVTLVPADDATALCHGRAYRVEGAAAAQTLEEIDHRERGGYERLEVEVRLAAVEETVRALTWIATPANPNWLGPAPSSEIAAQVRDADGPSGSNRDYVLRLSEALREIGAHDDHVSELAALLRG